MKQRSVPQQQKRGNGEKGIFLMETKDKSTFVSFPFSETSSTRKYGVRKSGVQCQKSSPTILVSQIGRIPDKVS